MTTSKEKNNNVIEQENSINILEQEFSSKKLEKYEQQFITQRKLNYSNSKVSTCLTKIKPNEKIALKILDNELIKIEIDKNVTPKEKLILNRINTFCIDDNKLLSLNQLSQSIYQDKKVRPSKKSINELLELLNNLNNNYVYLDITAEIKNRKDIELDDDNHLITKRKLLDFETCLQISPNKKTTPSILIKETPPILDYELKTNHQLITAKSRHVKTALTGLENNLNNAVLVDYIIQHIGRLEHSNNKLSNRLNYSTLFSNVTNEKLNRLQSQRLKDKTLKILNNLKNDKSCNLKNFKEIKENNQRIAIDFFVIKKSKRKKLKSQK